MSYTARFDMPFWDCPKCGVKNREEEYGELDSGSSLTCGKCDEEFDVIETDYTMHVAIEVR